VRLRLPHLQNASIVVEFTGTTQPVREKSLLRFPKLRAHFPATDSRLLYFFDVSLAKPIPVMTAVTSSGDGAHGKFRDFAV
jgi:hypothetical protein